MFNRLKWRLSDFYISSLLLNNLLSNDHCYSIFLKLGEEKENTFMEHLSVLDIEEVVFIYSHDKISTTYTKANH